MICTEVIEQPLRIVDSKMFFSLKNQDFRCKVTKNIANLPQLLSYIMNCRWNMTYAL